MAKKNELATKLSGEQPQGWKDQVGAAIEAEPLVPDSRKAGKYNRKTYLLTPELEGRIKALAEHERVGQNELVRYLLSYALGSIESGEHQLPTQPVQQRTLGV